MLNKLLVMAKVVIERFPRIAALYRGVRDQLDGMQEAQLTSWGFKLAGNAIMAQGEFELVVMQDKNKFNHNLLFKGCDYS